MTAATLPAPQRSRAWISARISAWPRAAQADGFWLGIVLALLSCLPVVCAHYPQMSDYPAHLARYYVMLDAARDPVLARYYGFTWQWTGNVGVDLAIRPLATLIGLEPAGRLITGIIPPLTAFGILAVEWSLRRRIGVGSFLALAFVWSPMMLIGLLNYALGQALALWAFAAWVMLGGRRWRWVLFLPVGLVVWACHLSAWGVLGVMVFGYEWQAGRSWRAFVAPWPLALPVAVMMFAHGTNGAFSYGAYWWVYKQAIWLKAMRDTSYPLDYLGEVLVGAAVLFAGIARRIDMRLGWAAALLLALSIALPRHISGGDYADYRMITAGLMVACLAIDLGPGKLDRAAYLALLFAAPGLYVARLAVTTLSWQADSAQTGRLLEALDHIPRGARVASAVLVPRDVWRLDHFEHIGAYAVFRNDALTNANFAVAHIHMLHLKVPFYADPSQRVMQPSGLRVDLSHFAPATDPAIPAGSAAQYLWYVGARQPDVLPAGAVVIWRGEGTLVARLANRGGTA